MGMPREEMVSELVGSSPMRTGYRVSAEADWRRKPTGSCRLPSCILIRTAHVVESDRPAPEQRLADLVPENLRFFAAELVRLCRSYTALDDVEHYQTTRLNSPLRRALVELGSRRTRRAILEA